MKKHHPSPKAKRKYYQLIEKSYRRLRNVLRKYNPKALEKA